MIFLLVVFFAATAYFFLICPSLRRRKMTDFSARPIAHRGIHDSPTVDENSMTAFRLAVERGVGIELDVRLTADGVPIIMHDASLMRMCGADRAVSVVTLAELKQHKLTVSGESIPTLAEVFEAVSGRVPLLIELKGEGISDIADKTAQVMEPYGGEYAVESFNPLYIRRYKKIARSVTRGILAERERGGARRSERILRRMASALLFNFLARPDFIAYRYSDGIGVNMRLCRALGAKTVAWTVRTPEEYADAAEKYDCIIGENIPERGKKGRNT